jgi:hypothetical protein
LAVCTRGLPGKASQPTMGGNIVSSFWLYLLKRRVP